jgi:hypothetical protein
MTTLNTKKDKRYGFQSSRADGTRFALLEVNIPITYGATRFCLVAAQVDYFSLIIIWTMTT